MRFYKKCMQTMPCNYLMNYRQDNSSWHDDTIARTREVYHMDYSVSIKVVNAIKNHNPQPGTRI